MSRSLIIGGIIVIIIPFFIGLAQHDFLLFILSLAGGATLSIIMFALAYILHNQKTILFFLEEHDKYINSLRKKDLQNRNSISTPKEEAYHAKENKLDIISPHSPYSIFYLCSRLAAFCYLEGI